ncbi:MAG: RNA polymerase sigma factor [Planctomycetota bacterium]|nr:RNA polymerase sigma factor [Planctomycetota bacterium]
MAESAGDAGTAVNQPLDEELVRAQLASGDLGDIAEGLESVHKRLGRHVVSALRRQFPGATAEDLADLWQETLRDTFECARDGKFDGNQPLMPFLCTIARRRAIDANRRRTPRERVEQAVGEALRGSQTNAKWQAFEAQERNETLEEVRVYVQTLPHKQRIVFQEFMDGYPDTESMEVLRVRVDEVMGEPQTLVSVKSALQAARDKVREFMARRGLAGPSARRRP